MHRCPRGAGGTGGGPDRARALTSSRRTRGGSDTIRRWKVGYRHLRCGSGSGRPGRSIGRQPLAIGCGRFWSCNWRLFLDRLTLRKVIAFIPVVILILAYMHRIPVPPELMLVGDVLAYLDIFFADRPAMGILSRAATVLFLARRALARTAELMSRVLVGLQRLDFRHRRATSATRRKAVVRSTEERGRQLCRHS